MAATTNIRLDKINLDASIQCRATINIETVNEYTIAMLNGAEFPPVVLFASDDQHYIGDGWHRIMAAKQATFLDIPATVHAGGRADALKFALGANIANGLRRTHADKRRCIEIALKEFPKLSDSAIGDMCGVDHKTVTACRPSNLGNSHVDDDKRVGKDGKSRKLPSKKTPVQPKDEPPEDDDNKWDGIVRPPSNGRRFAYIAIIQLEQIHDDDTEREAAFEDVQNWLNAHRRPQ